jgi:hypothetical protein
MGTTRLGLDGAELENGDRVLSWASGLSAMLSITLKVNLSPRQVFHGRIEPEKPSRGSTLSLREATMMNPTTKTLYLKSKARLLMM